MSTSDDHIDTFWAELQAEEDAARKAKLSKIKTSSTKKVKVVSKEKKKEAPVQMESVINSVEASGTDKEFKPEQLHFQIRSVMNGDLGQRKASLRIIAE